MDIKKLRKKWDSVDLSYAKNRMEQNIIRSQQQQKEFNKKIYDREIQRRKVELSTKKESPNAFTRTNQMKQYNAPTAVVPNSIENRVNKMYEKIILKQEAEKDVINQAKRMFENSKNIKATLSEEKSSLTNKPRADAKLGQEDLERLSEMDRKGRLEALKGRNEETFQEANLYALTKSNQQTEKKVNEAEGTKKILPTLEYLGKELGQNTVSSFGQIKATAEHIQGRDKNLKALENAQKYQEAISPLGENINNKFIKNLGMATEGLGQQMPQILLGSTGTGALVGGFTEFSNTYNEMTLENPNNKTKTMVTALLKGTVAGGLEHALGLFGGSKIDDLSKSQLAGIKNKLVRNAMATGYDVAGEITEEQLENIIGYVIDKAVNDKNITMEQVIKEAEATFKQTGLTTLLMSALGLGGNTRGEVNNLRDNLDIIEASNISGTEKKNLKEWVSSENVSNDQLYTQIGKMINENNISEQILEKTVENSQNRQTTMENKPVLENGQQVISNKGKIAQNQTSQQPLGNDKYAIKMPDSNYKFEKTGNQNEDILDESMSKSFNNSEDTHKLNRTLKKIMKDKNLSIVFDENVTDENGNIVDGKYESGVITINPNSTRAFEHIATHELTHAIGTKEMLEMVEKYRQSNSEFNSKVETLLKNYNKTELTEEALAEVSGQLFGTQEFINNVKNTNPNLFQKIYSEIKYLWHQLRGYKNENQFIDDLYYKWTQAYNSKAELNQTTKNLAMDKNNDLNYNKDNNLNLEVNKNDDISIRGEVSQGNAILQGETNKPRDSRQNRENNTIGNGRQSSSTNNGMDKGMFGTELQRDSRSNTKTQPLDNTDNRGTKLSDGMKEYMKDTAIRIDNKLLNVFHNTEADFSVFDRDYIGSNSGDVGFFGEGFYFAKTPGEARTYGSKQMSTYLKVVNPFYFGTLSQLDGKKVKSYNSTILQVRNLVKQFPEIGSQEVAFSDGVTLKDYQEAFDRVYSNANVQKFKSEDYYGNEGYHYKVGFEGFIKEYDTTLDYTEQEVRMDFLNDYIKEETDLPMLYKITDVIQNMYQTKSEAEDGIAGGFSKILEKYGYDGIVVGDSVEHADEFVVFHSEQVKDIKNQNPTSNPDINYLKQGNTEWQEYLEENFKTEGTRTTKEQIRLPEKNVLQENTSNLKQTTTKKETDTEIAKVLNTPVTKQKPQDRKWAIFKASVFDKGIVFEDLSKKAKNRELEAKWDYTLSSSARAQYAIGNARFDENGNKISKGLTEIIDEVGDKIDDFQNYMYHLLNIDRMSLKERFGIDNKPVFGKNIGKDYSERKVAEFEKTNPKFKEWAQDVYDYANADKAELVKNGVISQELSDKFAEMYPHYVPIQRANKLGNAINLPLDTRRTGVNTPIKQAKGGSSDLNPLFETLAGRTMQTYRASARNSLGVELKNTLESLNSLNSNVNDAESLDSIMDTMADEKSTSDLLQASKDGKLPTFTVFENGNKVTFDISEDIYDALKPTSEKLKIQVKILNKVGNLRRAVLTEYNPLFSITNTLKDTQDVLLNSQHALATYKKYPEAYWQIMRNGYWKQEYIQNGGEQNTYFKDGEFEKVTKKGLLKQVVTFPLDAISKMNGALEMAPRLAEYIASREQGRNIQTSMLDASRVTTNFKAGGDFTKALNRNGATFLNAGVQGAMQAVRNVREANVKGLKGWTMLACKMAVAGAPVLILNNLMWEDDDDYEQLQDYVKDGYYIIGKRNDGTFIRIPKGRTLAVIQKVVSNVDKYINNEGSLNIDEVSKDFWETAKFTVENLAPSNPLDNNVISPIIQTITNTSWYGEDIVPSRLQNVPNAEQFDETTDKFSKWLGEKTGVSPMKINYLLDQYGGGVSDILLPLGTPQAENTPLEDKFVTNPVMKSKYPGEFFEKSDEITKSSNSMYATDTDIVKGKYMSYIQSNLSDLYKEKREIQNSIATDEEKKRQLKEVQKQINETARMALEEVEKPKMTGTTALIGNEEFYKNSDGEWERLKDKDKIPDVTMKSYSDYKIKKEQATDKKRKEKNNDKATLNDAEMITIIKESDYTDKEKDALFDDQINDKTYKHLKLLNNNDITKINQYMDYKTADLESNRVYDGTKKGKSVSGSAKNKLTTYLNNSSFNGVERLYLYGQNYKLNSTQRAQLQNYVKKLELTPQEEKELWLDLSSSNIVEMADGSIRWK